MRKELTKDDLYSIIKQANIVEVFRRSSLKTKDDFFSIIKQTNIVEIFRRSSPQRANG
jgi:predicted CoA-binding protein